MEPDACISRHFRSAQREIHEEAACFQRRTVLDVGVRMGAVQKGEELEVEIPLFAF
jgi:hypothetical protein